MKRILRWAWPFALALTVVFVVGGCTMPIIYSATSRGDQIKFIYREGSRDVGVFACKMEKDGTLSECKKKPVKFKEDK